MRSHAYYDEKTIASMVLLYCRKKHHTEAAPCNECADLLAYARDRQKNCRFGSSKPACSHCSVHCYKPAMRLKVREVMRFSGSRMILHHPLLAIRHLLLVIRSSAPTKQVPLQ